MKTKVVIIGASITGAYTTFALVKNGFDGDITLIDEKDVFPINTYPLSKDWMKDKGGIEPPFLKKAAYYEKHGIDLKRKTRVEAVNWEDKTVTTHRHDVIPYDKLIVATGSKLRRINLPGDDAEGIFYLRNFNDAKAMKEWVKDVQTVSIIGAGFIGLELASTFNQLGKTVSVFVRSGKPLEAILGEHASDYVMKMHASHGTAFLLNEEANAFIKDDLGQIASIQTKSGKNIPTEMVVVAVGVEPNIPFKLDVLTEDGCVVVNQYGETSLPDIYAGGDVVKWPYQDRLIHVEHWENAWGQGTSLAKNVINEKSSAYDSHPYFWTDQYDQTFEYLGHAATWNKTFLRGSLKDGHFAIAYVDADNHPLAILFANGFETRKDVEGLLSKAEPLDEKKFADLAIPVGNL